MKNTLDGGDAILEAIRDLGVKHIDSHVVLRPLKAFHGIDLQALIPSSRRKG